MVCAPTTSPETILEPHSGRRSRTRGLGFQLRLQQQNPLRPLTWRWSLANRWASERIGSPPRRLDPWVADAVRYQRALDRCGDDRDWEHLARRMPDLRSAHLLHEGGGFAAWRLEAFLLTREPLDAIAARLDLPVKTVEAYEALFFCVLDRLDARDYLAGAAIRYRSIFPTAPAAPGVMARLLAYFGGPPVLEAYLLDAIDALGNYRPIDLKDLDTPAGRRGLRIRLAVAVMAEDDPGRALELLRIRSLIAEREGQSAVAPGTTLAIQLDLDRILSTMTKPDSGHADVGRITQDADAA